MCVQHSPWLLAVHRSQSSLLQSLSRGLELADDDVTRIVPLLSVFCSLFTYSMLSLHDAEFYGEDKGEALAAASFWILPFDNKCTCTCISLDWVIKYRNEKQFV